MIINGLFNALSFFSLKTGHFDGIDRPIPVIVIVLVLSVMSLVAAWGLQQRAEILSHREAGLLSFNREVEGSIFPLTAVGKRQRWARTVGLISTILMLMLAIVGNIVPVTGGQLDLGPIIDIL